MPSSEAATFIDRVAGRAEPDRRGAAGAERHEGVVAVREPGIGRASRAARRAISSPYWLWVVASAVFSRSGAVAELAGDRDRR